MLYCAGHILHYYYNAMSRSPLQVDVSGIVDCLVLVINVIAFEHEVEQFSELIKIQH